MAKTIDIGSNLETAAPPIIALCSQAGGVTVRVVAGASLPQHYDLHSTATYTTAVGSSQSHPAGQVVHLKPTGRTTITLTGTGY